MKSKIILCAAALWSMAAMAEIPAGYYDACEGKTKAALKNQLYNIVKNHTVIPYGNGANETWSAFYHTDVHEDGYWWDIYTTNKVPAANGVPNNNTMNKEHTFPKSWWGGGKSTPAYSDIVHLMPTNSVANSTRSNWPYAEVQTPKSISSKCPNPRFKHGTPKAGQGGGSATVFEPDDEFKGDLARTYFYMVTCYQDLNWTSNGPYTAASGSYPTLQPWAIEMLLRWHREDPVSQKEKDRNEGVYSQQHNRNPFIDYPEMAEHIWGNKMDTPWTSTGTPVDPDPVDPDPVDPNPDKKATLTAPTPDDWYRFPDVHPGESKIMEIPMIGSGFTHNLTARIGGNSASSFKFKVGSLTLDAISVNSVDVASSEGYTLKVIYAPTEITQGESSDFATITITCADLEEPVVINLQGHCISDIELNAVTVLPVDNLTDDGYTVSWLPCATEPDLYTVTRKIYDPTDDSLEDILTYEVDGNHTTLVIDDRNPLKKEALSVTATLDGVDSPAGNEIVVNATSGIESVDAEQTGRVRYFDASGMELPASPQAPGVYVVRVGDHTAKTVIIK